jgi:septum site-determining protein MinD
MARIIVVTSGKGGVGKTTSSASFSTGLALRGHKTAVLDFDVGLRNLDLIMGCERRVVYDLINVINGEASLNQALIKDKHCDNLFILPASQTRDKDALSEEGVERVLNELVKMGFEYIICDSPAGIEHGALMALTFADEAIVVTNPEVSSVRDSDRILGIIQAKSRRAQSGGEPVKEHLLITRYSPKRVEARRNAVLPGRAGNPAHPADRHHPGIGIGAARVEPGQSGDPHQGHRRGRSLRGRGRALPRRGRAAALHQLRKAGPAAAHLWEASDMALLSFLFPPKRRARPRPRKGCRSSSRASAPTAAARISCRPCTAN